LSHVGGILLGRGVKCGLRSFVFDGVMGAKPMVGVPSPHAWFHLSISREEDR